MLKVEALETGYGKKQVLFGIDLEAAKENITAIIGPNGSGKSTALKSIFGLIPVWSGNVICNGEPITNRGTRANVRDGIGFVPQGNRVFDEMTVLENLEIGGWHVQRRIEKNMGTLSRSGDKKKTKLGKA
jgi:branched-chain amino acid transport system ATP-binding protein